MHTKQIIKWSTIIDTHSMHTILELPHNQEKS